MSVEVSLQDDHVLIACHGIDWWWGQTADRRIRFADIESATVVDRAGPRSELGWKTWGTYLPGLERISRASSSAP